MAPSVSTAEHNAMEAAAHGHSKLGIPRKVGEEFVRADKTAGDQASLAPNAALPAYRTKPACDSADAIGHAAGTALISPEGEILLLRRSGKEENFPHYWDLPGGGVDEGETPEQAAERETREETGHSIEGGRPKLLDQVRTPKGKVFHTFVRSVAGKFAPKLGDEHAGYVWSPLDALPQPMHPALAQTLQTRLGIADDMKPEDWAGLRDGFLKWTIEEEREPEHAADLAFVIAMDRDSVRSFDRDGRMRIAIANLSKEQIRPYKGDEIPGWQDLGLEPGKIYNLFCSGDELEKAAPTFNGIQLLKKHTPVNADDHKKYDIVGTTGTTAKFASPYLQNGLVVWSQEGIDLIESEEQKELSCGYHYKPVMQPGTFQGEPFDGRMTELEGNHVTLVGDGRAGSECVVEDSALELQWAAIERAMIGMASAT